MSKETQLGSLRENFSSEIRKQNRESMIKNKRKLDDDSAEPVQFGSAAQDKQSHIHDPALKAQVVQFLQQSFTLNNLSELCECVNSQDVIKMHYGVIGIRKVLSVEIPPVQPIIDANLVPKLIEFMKLEQYPHLQLEAAWSLTNVASGTSVQTQTIIDKGGIPIFVSLLCSNYPIVAEQALWAIGNIAGDSSHYRDFVLQCDGLSNLSKLVMGSQNPNIIKHGTWAISNLCRGKPIPKYHYTKIAVPVLIKVMCEQSDYEILTDSLWALSYLTDGDEARIDWILSLNILPGLAKNLEQEKVSILIPTIRCIGNIATGNDLQTQAILDHPTILNRLAGLLSHEKNAIKRETCWTLSNITAGTQQQASIVLNNQQILQKVFNMSRTEAIEIQKEALWVLSNATNKNSVQDTQILIQFGFMDIIIDNLVAPDTNIVSISLEALSNIFQKGEQTKAMNGQKNVNRINEFLEIFKEKNGLDRLQDLQTHKSDKVYQKTCDLIEDYFEVEDPLADFI